MQKIRSAIAACTLALILAGGGVSLAGAQDHDNHQYVRHDEWRKGQHIKDEDWRRGEVVREEDWKTHHLRRPPAGYEWRLIDGNYVMANSSGVISMTVVAH
jgi:Ni/Co efflux regulator RcnB